MEEFYTWFRTLICFAVFGLGLIVPVNIKAQINSKQLVHDSVFGDSLDGFNSAAIMKLAASKRIG